MPARRRVLHVGVLAAAFVFAFAVRWLTYTGLGGDDHWSLWTAATFLKGDLPFRDFVDVGDPLYWGMSALAQWIVGYRIVGEVLLGTVLIATAFALAFNLAWQASGRLWVAALLTVMALLLVTTTELYSYPKIFIYPLGLWLCWRYVDKPTLARAIALAAGVAVAWGYRHDHGLYVGIGAAAAVLATHWPEGPRRVLAAWTRFGVALLLLLAPYLILIQANEGIVPYVLARLAIARQLDAAGRTFIRFTIDRTAPSHWIRIDPPRPAQVQVDWKPEVANDVRVALERQYSLTDGLAPKHRLYEYFLTDTSRDNLVALMSDQRIAERRGISLSYRETNGSQVLSEAVATEAAPPDAPPGARARVSIQWDRALAEAELPALERRYGLLDATPDRNRWAYTLTSVSTNNIRAIIEDSHVYDTGLIDRSSYRPMEESSGIRLQRTVPLLRLSVAPRYWHGLNAAVWLYYVFFALPPIVLIMLARDRVSGTGRGVLPNARAKMLAAAVMMAVANLALLRKLGYISDHGNMVAILGAWVIGQAFAGGRPRPVAAVLPAMAAGLLLFVSAFATITYVSPLNTLATAGFNEGVQGTLDKAVRSFRGYATSPPIDEYAPPGTTGDRGLLRYIYECTRPDDRIWLLSETYAVHYYTERRVVGHIYWGMGFLATPEYQRRTIERIDKQEVPFILAIGGKGALEYLEAYDLVHDYAARRYTTHHVIPEDKVERGLSIWLSTDGRRKATGTYELFGLPCFK